MARTATSRTAEAPLRSLAALVGEDQLDRFLTEHQGRDAFRRRLPDGWAQSLFDWARLNEALEQQRLAPPRLRLERAGGDASKDVFKTRRTRRGRTLTDLDPVMLNARLRDGATLILDAAHEVSPPLQALCADLAAEYAASCQTNLYACWGTTQGFDVHWDDHDVFVVQVEGAKRWALYGSTREWPSYRDTKGAHAKPTEPIEEIVLEPGDLLYLPRGYWHAAVGMGVPTLHLTIGLTRKSGVDFLHWLAEEALSHDRARADLMLEQDDSVLGRQISELISAAVTSTDPFELGRRYRRHVQATLAQRPKLSFPFIGQAGDVLASETLIRMADGPRSLESANGGAAFVLRFRGVDYTLSAALEASFGRLASGSSLSVGAMEADVSDDVRPLVAGLVKEMIGLGVFVARPEAAE